MSATSFSTIAALSTIAVLTGLFVKYPDCALFDGHRENVPHIKGDPLIGNLLAVSKNKNRYFEYLVEVYEELDTMTFRSSSLGIPSGISTVNPKNIDHVLRANFQNYVKSENFRHIFHDVLGEGIFNTDGESWRLQRKTSSQIFHVKNFQTAFTSIFVDHVQTLSNKILDSAIDDHQFIDFHDLMLRFTMDTFVEIAFGVKLDSLLGEQEFAKSFDAIQLDNYRRIIFPLHGIVRGFQDIFSSQKTIKQHIQTLDDFIYGIIKEKKLKQQQDPDMNTETYKTDLLLRFMKTKNSSGEDYTDKELRDTMLNLIIAGRDTSAQAISWFCYSIMEHPQVQEKLLEEIDQFITNDIEKDTVALYEAIQKMKYAHAVLYEVLRLYPSVPSNRRQAINDDILPDGTHVRKGDEVIFQPFCQGRHKKVWGPDAKEFKPERWLSKDGNLVRAEAGKYIVFHMGPRICLGQNMAILEVLLAMSLLLKRYRFTRVQGHRVEFLNQVTLSMKNGLKVHVEKRGTFMQNI